MKTLIITSLLLASFSSFGAELVCGSTKASHKRTYPINEAAINFFSKQGLKACTGTTARARIKAAVEAAKHTVTFKVVTADELTAARNAMAKLGGNGGPTL